MKRFPFLDWMRGLAIVIMIQCHTFNSFTRADVRESGTYVLSQFVGGMAAPLFLFMVGMTLAFQIESMAKREVHPLMRWLGALRRSFYILAIAYLFRFSNFVASIPKADWHELVKVDILNSMGLALIVLSITAVFDAGGRIRFAVGAALVIAAVSPWIAGLDWSGTPKIIQDYLVPAQASGRFPFFPCASYAGFGLAAGMIVRRATEDRLDRVMQWSMLIGLALIAGAHYFSVIPFSIYAHSSFWTDSPPLILIRVGVMLLFCTGAYLWTAYLARPSWSWMQCLGKNSLMVYWIHVMLVYGDIIKRVKGSLTIPQTVLATLIVILLMTGLSAVWLWWKSRRAEKWRLATSVAGRHPLPAA